MNNEDEDYQQVYVVGDKEEFYGDGGSNIVDSNNSIPFIVAFGLVIFLPLAFFAIVAGFIAKHTSGIYYGDLMVPLSLGCIAITYIAITKYIGSSKVSDNHEACTNASRKNRGKPLKKFKNVSEHKKYLSSIGVDYDSRFGQSNPQSNKDNSATDSKKVADEIELAVEALIRLGFGAKKAKDWVTRAITAGIETSDTQGLIKFALSRGASISTNVGK